MMHVNAQIDEEDVAILKETFRPDVADIIIKNGLISRVAEFISAHYALLQALDVPDIKEVQ